MITRLTLGNFRSLGRPVDIELGKFTALVGANGSGKSSVVLALDFVRDAMRMGLSGAITDRGGMASIRRASPGHPFNVLIGVSLQLPDGSASYGFELSSERQDEYRVKREEGFVTTQQGTVSFRIEDGVWDGPEGLRPKVDAATLALPAIGGDERFKGLFDFLRNTTVYAIYPDTLRQLHKYNPEKPMRRHGENWVSILNDQPAETWKPEMIEVLQKLTGDIDDVSLSKAAGYLVARFRHGSVNRWFDAVQESDGTLRVAGIVTALLQRPTVPVLCVEEPELTVHPGALPMLVDLLQQACRHSQVIVTTHSPELLDLVDADQVRVVERVDGVTRVAPMRKAQKDTVRDGLMRLGELMITVGLQGELLSPT